MSKIRGKEVNKENMRSLFFIWLSLSSALFLVFLILKDWRTAYSFWLGGALSGFNLSVLIWSWRRIFNGKGLALAMGTIVIKYAVLTVVIYKLIAYRLVDPLGFLVGLTIVLPILLILSYQYKTQVIDMEA